MICSDAGPLGREVEHPGPVVAYSLAPGGLLIPRWLGDLAVADGLFRPEALLPLRQSW